MTTDKTILLVEDNPDDALLMKRALKKAGVINPLYVAEDGQRAIDYFSDAVAATRPDSPPVPSYVLLDIKLPYKTGHDVLAWMQTQHNLSGVVRLMLTSSSDANDIKKAYRLGAHSYLVKPTSSDQLLEISKAFKSYWLTFNQLPQ